MREVGDQPRISEPCRTLHRRIHHRREPDRRPALAQRLQADAEVVDLENLAVVRDLVLGPQPAHDLDALIHALRALLERHVEGLELGVAIAHADAEHVAAAR